MRMASGGHIPLDRGSALSLLKEVVVKVTAVKLIALLTLVLCTPPLAAGAQPTGNVNRIAFLSSGSSKVPSPVLEGFREGLRGLGWVEGQNIVIDYRFAYGHHRLPAL